MSYAREDHEAAMRIYGDLKSEGLQPWLDSEDLLPGERWRSRIREVISDSDFFLLLMSSKSINKRGYVQKEMRQGFEILEELPAHEIFLIPARVEDCQPKHDLLQELNWVDLFPSYEKGLEKIVRAITAKARGEASQRRQNDRTHAATSSPEATSMRNPRRAAGRDLGQSGDRERSRRQPTAADTDMLTIDISPATEKQGDKLEFIIDRFPTVLDLMNLLWSRMNGAVPAFSYGTHWGIREAESKCVLLEDAMKVEFGARRMRDALITEAAGLSLEAAGMKPGMNLEIFLIKPEVP